MQSSPLTNNFSITDVTDVNSLIPSDQGGLISNDQTLFSTTNSALELPESTLGDTTTNFTQTDNISGNNSSIAEQVQKMIDEYMPQIMEFIMSIMSMMGGIFSSGMQTGQSTNFTGSGVIPDTSQEGVIPLKSPQTPIITPNDNIDQPQKKVSSPDAVNGDHSGDVDEYGFSTHRPEGGKISDEEAEHQSELLVKALMKDFDLTEEQAIGIVANIYHESDGLNPHINEYGSTPGGDDFGAPNDSQFGYGWCQWTGSRKQDYINFCEENGYETGSPSSNYAFLKYELSGNAVDDPQTNGAVDKVRTATTAEEATRIFNAEFERPTMPMLEKRLLYAAFLENKMVQMGDSNNDSDSNSA